MKITKAQIEVGAFLYSIENMGGPSLFEQPDSGDNSEVDFLKLMFNAYFEVHGPALALCYGIYHDLAVPTSEGEKQISSAFEIFCRRFELDESKSKSLTSTEVLILLNKLFAYSGEKAELDRPGVDPEIIALMDIFPLMRTGPEYRQYRLNS